ncbi:MAG: hypothetical protein RLZZ387_2761 [Chloroflexota bacterium]|jgi:predicted kinase
MPTLSLICGLPGAGKTTLARRLEQERAALRLSPDEWIAVILADHADTAERDRLRDPVESLQWDLARRVLALGRDVILENGFWSREERARYRAEAQALGARVELHYLAASREVLWERLARRNAQLPPGTFAVTETDLDTWAGWFEPPAADEPGFETVVVHTPADNKEERPTMSSDTRRARIDRLAALPDELAALLSSMVDAQLDAPAPGDPWTVRQVAHHIADSHMNAFVRTKLILTEDHPTLKPYDQDAWALLPDSKAMPVESSLAILRGVHARWVRLFEALSDEEWGRTAHHPENGTVTLEGMLASYAQHSDDHLAQMRRILAGDGSDA